MSAAKAGRGYTRALYRILNGRTSAECAFLARSPRGPGLRMAVEAIVEHRSQIWKAEYLKRVRAFPQVRDLFQRLLRRGVQVALASSAKGDALEIYKQMAGIDDLVETETSADDAARSKPHPNLFAAALRLLGAKKEAALVIGDSPWDAIAARRLGVRSIGVLCGGFAEADLLGAGCSAIYRDPADLLARLEESSLLGE